MHSICGVTLNSFLVYIFYKLFFICSCLMCDVIFGVCRLSMFTFGLYSVASLKTGLCVLKVAARETVSCRL